MTRPARRRQILLDALRARAPRAGPRGLTSSETRNRVEPACDVAGSGRLGASTNIEGRHGFAGVPRALGGLGAMSGPPV